MHPSGLPVEEVVTPVVNALDTAGSAVLVAPPGSGKTTIVPLHLLDHYDDKILVLEPRRLAARAAARRMADLIGEPVGERVGYVTRHDRASGPRTQVEVVTEGILTRRLQSDPSLADVSVVIFDELHERNLQTDLGLALALDARSVLRPDLKILAMSATIDADRVAAILGNAPVVTADGSLHPVDVRWVPPGPRLKRIEDHVASVVRRALDNDEGDLLVFLPGMAEIRRVAERLEGVLADVRILHGSIPPSEQDAAIAPSVPPFRKVVLSTDIAESSLTVEGIGVVIDSGLARSPRFDPHTGMTRLQTVSVSRASADQRSGRAGRLGPGVSYRLWSKMEHAARRPHTDPEITQVDLAGLALELAMWGVSDPSDLHWLDPPPPGPWAEGVELLTALGALTEGQITDRGRRMARLPLHPRLAAMVVAASDSGDGALAVWLATLLSERDPLRGRPSDLPVDIALRIRLLTDRGFRHPAANVSSLHRLRDVGNDIARRADVVGLGDVDLDNTGRVLALAFPDRLAVRRGSPGRFQLRTGTTCFTSKGDSLATEEFVVAADLDGRRKDARIRLAAGIDREDVLAAFAHEIDTSSRLHWDGDRLVARTESRLGGMVLEGFDMRPEPGVGTTAALLRRIRDRGLASLPWTKGADSLRHRVRFLHDHAGDAWPDWSDENLRRTLDEWLGPHLAAASGWDDVQNLDLTSVLRTALGYDRIGRLDRAAPEEWTLPSGRKVRLDYSNGTPTLSVRVQELYGVTDTPRVGNQPLVLELLSPAGRPVQITSDLAGFWSGSWHEVRKEMAGRYPKHDWPVDPTAPSQ